MMVTQVLGVRLISCDRERLHSIHINSKFIFGGISHNYLRRCNISKIGDLLN